MDEASNIPKPPEDKAEMEKQARGLAALGQHTRAYELRRSWHFWYGSKE